MNKVCKDLPVLQDRLANSRDHQRRRFKEETRVIQEFQAPQATQATQDLLVPPVDRKEKRVNQESQANEANQAKTVIQVLRDSPGVKARAAHLVPPAGMEREDSKVNVDSPALQEW